MALVYHRSAWGQMSEVLGHDIQLTYVKRKITERG